MKPLQWIGFGLLIVGAKATLHGGYDLLVDPVGWLLVLVGVRRFASVTTPRQARLLVAIAVVALLCSGPLWWPDTRHALEDADPAVLWSVSLAELAFQLLLCHVLARRAWAAHDEGPSMGLRLCEVGLAGGIIAPIVYYTAEQGWLNGVAALGQIVQLAVIVLCFVFSGRTWAGAGSPRDAAEPPLP
ncbi:hypothetical protein [Nocardioides montaniterrae]